MSRCAAVVLLVLATGCNRAPGTAPKPEVDVAAAANLSEVFKQIGPQFEAQTGIHPLFSFGSTVQLTRQIENAAPFDIIAAADSVHVDDLDRQGLLLPGSRAVYAVGVLALWIPAGGEVKVDRLEDLTRPEVRAIAVAKPDLAPYGRAAVETLERAGLWEKVKPKIVYAENISMAKQYGMSKNADAVFTAYSLVLKESGKVIRVEERLHRPITQELGIVAASRHTRAARAFADYLLNGNGRDALRAYGYAVRP